MGRRDGIYLNAEFFVQLTRERAQFRLPSLDESSGQLPHVWVRPLIRSPMCEEDTIFTNQRAHDDLVHSRNRARTSDNPNIRSCRWSTARRSAGVRSGDRVVESEVDPW
jgi:hypothetical protein